MSQQSQWIELYCQLRHHSSIVKYVCLAESCSEFRFICDKCVEFENHKNHQQVNLQEAELYIKEQMQKYQELENYLSSLCNSLTELIKQLQTVIKEQHSLDLNLSQSTQKNQLLDKIVKFDKISDQIKMKIHYISDIYREEIKKLIELVNVKNENNSQKQIFEKTKNDDDRKNNMSNQSVQSFSSNQQTNEQILNQLPNQEEKLSIDYYIEKAYLLRIQGKYIESIVFYKQATDIDQKNLICWRSIGDCHRLIKEFLEAIPYYNKALEIEQNDIPSLIGKGECLRMIQDYLESKLLYEKVQQIDEKNLESRVGLGECLRHLGSFLEAIQQYDLALEIDQKNVVSLNGKGYCLRNVNSFSEADACYLQVLSIDPNHEQSKLGHGSKFYQILDLCLSELNKLHRSRYSFVVPNEHEQYQNVFQTEDISNRGPQKTYHICQRREHIQHNNNDFNKSFQVLPDKKQPHNLKRSESFDRKQVLEFCNYGNLPEQSIADNLKKNGQYEEALKFYEKALEKDPNDIPSLNGKGNCLRLLLKFPESLETLERALEINRNSISLYGKGECLRMQKFFKEAEEFYKESLDKAKGESQSDPIFFMNLRGRGDILRAQGEYEKSIEFYDQALKLNQNHSLSLLGKAESLRRLGRYEDSKVYYDKSLSLNQNDFMSLTGLGISLTETLGETLRLLQKYKEAQECYEKALKIDKDRVICLRGLSQCLRKQFQPKKALEVINRALTIYPQDENSLNLKGYLFQVYLLEICLKEIKRQEEALNKQRNNL